MEEFIVDVMVLTIMTLFIGIIAFSVIKGSDYIQLLRDRKIRNYVYGYEEVEITLLEIQDDYYCWEYYYKTPDNHYRISYECYRDLKTIKTLRKMQKERGEI
jgi:hypothetical protein